MRSVRTWRIHRLYASRCCPFVRQASLFANTGAFHHDRLQAAPIRCFQTSIRRQGAGDTIFALSTPPGRSAIAVIRLSGSGCLSVYRTLCPGKPDPRPRHATLRTLFAPGQSACQDSILDPGALILFFPAPHTVTGEDVIELHVHGGPAIIQAVLRAVSGCSGDVATRYAEPGEFTRRAFWNDKLDLLQAEALGDVLSANTEQQRKQSLRASASRLTESYDQWRKQLVEARGELEALIDFSEDHDFEEGDHEMITSVAQQVTRLKTILEQHLYNAEKGEMLRSGIDISLLGAPNAGKSSLLNQIVGREAAIVSQEAGTTRDVVEVGVDLGGYFCRFGDTAGLRAMDVAGHVEREGMKRAKARAEASDVIIIVVSFEQTAAGVQLHLDPEVMRLAHDLSETGDGRVLFALNKVDLVADQAVLDEARVALMASAPFLKPTHLLPVSCLSQDHRVRAFIDGLCAHFSRLTAAQSPDGIADDQSIWQDSLGASERHRLLLQGCVDALGEFVTITHNDPDVVVAAECLRTAADCLAKITGRGEAGDVEEVLGVVFEKFCVGK